MSSLRKRIEESPVAKAHDAEYGLGEPTETNVVLKFPAFIYIEGLGQFMIPLGLGKILYDKYSALTVDGHECYLIKFTEFPEGAMGVRPEEEWGLFLKKDEIYYLLKDESRGWVDSKYE